MRCLLDRHLSGFLNKHVKVLVNVEETGLEIVELAVIRIMLCSFCLFEAWVSG